MHDYRPLICYSHAVSHTANIFLKLQGTLLLCSRVSTRIYLSNKGGAVYGQYTKAKGCSNARHNAECLDTALVPQPWYIGHISQTPEVPYCDHKLITNIIAALKINVLSYQWYTV